MWNSASSSLITIGSVLLVSVCAATASAQRVVPTPEHPPMTSQRLDRDKETLYALFSENKRGITPEQQRRAYLAAKEYVRWYSDENDAYTKEARVFVINFEKGLHHDEIYSAYTARNYAKAFELGRPVLKTEPADFFVLSVLAEAGYENALAGNSSLNDETIDYLRKAIELLEAGKIAKADPFKSMDAASGFLNLARGWFVRDKAPVEAATAFERAVQPKSPYEKDPIAHYRLGVAILKGEFAQLSAEYNEKYGAKGSSPEQQAMLERITQVGGKAIDAYARAVALSDPKRAVGGASNPQFTPEFREKVMAQLTALYKSFHNNSDAGLNELIANSKQ